MSSSKLKRQSTTRTPGSPIAAATRSVDQKISSRGSVLTEVTLSALGFPGHAVEEGAMRLSFAIAIAAALVLTTIPATATAKTVGDPSVQFERAALDRGTASGVMQSGGLLTLATTGLSSGSYDDPFDSADRAPIAYQSGSWTSEFTKVAAFDELVASWNAQTPAGTWIRIEMQASGDPARPPTKWYTMGIWAAT